MSVTTNQLLFSLIIPVFNGSLYITDCLKSIMNQSFDNYEVIVVDDGSTDNSVEQIEKFTSQYENIKLIKQPNSGTFNARLNGVFHSKGEYLFFVDSDDMIRNDALSYLASAISKNGFIAF